MNTSETKVGAMTPPPWEAQDQLGKLCVFGPEGECIAVCNSSISPNEANARAIAALPDVLEALQRAYAQLVAFEDSFEGAGVHDLWEDAVSNAKAALQKAGCL